MNLQDRSAVRSAAELEKKYNFSKLLGLSTNIETNANSIIKVDNTLKNFLGTSTSSLEDIESEIDGKVTTWYYSGVPSLSNYPANTWTTNEEKIKHIGDMYYDRATGYCYRYNSSYTWDNIRDGKVTEALALADAAQDTADGKRRIFVTQPTPPYENGDLWVGGSNGDIKVCQISKIEGQNYNANDFILASKYTDNTVANAIVDELGGTTTSVLSGQVVTISSSFAKYTDLATAGSTTINGANITTGTIDATKVKISNNNVVLDSTGIKLANGAKIMGSDGLKSTLLFKNQLYPSTLGYIDKTLQGDVENLNLYCDIYIPTGFTITKATAIVIHTPFLWELDKKKQPEVDENGDGWPDMETVYTWGYCRNIKLYKEDNPYQRKAFGSPNSEIYDLPNSCSEIVGAFGTNGWSPSVPNGTLSGNNIIGSYETEEKKSIDIKNNLSIGINRLIIKCPDVSTQSFKSPWNGDYNSQWNNYKSMNENTGLAILLTVVEGYITYS